MFTPQKQCYWSQGSLGATAKKGRGAGDVWAETQHWGENLSHAGQNPVEDGERVVKYIYQKKIKLCETLPSPICYFHFIFCNTSVLPFLLTIPLIYYIYHFLQGMVSSYCMKISVQFCSLVKASGFQSCRGKLTYVTWMNSEFQKIGDK